MFRCCVSFINIAEAIIALKDQPYINPEGIDWKKPTQKLLRCGALPFSDTISHPLNERHLFGQGLNQRVTHHIHVTIFLTCDQTLSIHIQEPSNLYDALRHGRFVRCLRFTLCRLCAVGRLVVQTL